MDRDRLGGTVTELSDAEVFGAPAPPKEMSDADVLGAPAPAAGPSPPISGPEGWSTAAHDMVNSTPTGGIMQAFGQGFREASGPEPLGLSPESTKWLSKIGVFAPAGQKGYENPFQAFNEGVIVPAAAALDGAIRTFEGTYRGLQAAGVEAGLPRDIVSLPDAFAGSPGALGHVEMRPGLPKGSAPVETGAATSSMVEGYHGSPTPFTEFSDTGPYFFTPDAATASQYAMTSQSDTAAIMRGDKDFIPSEKSPHVVPAFLQMDRPYKVDMWDLEKATNARDPNWLRENGYDSAILEDKRDPRGTEFIVLDRDQIKPKYSLADTVNQAQDLGVIGPDRPPLTDAASPKEAAERAIPASSNPGEKVTQELPGQQDAWQQRFDGFVGKLDAPGDVQQLIKDAAKENGDFLPARQGDIPLSHVESIAEAAGVDPAEVNPRGLGRNLQNDSEVRVAMRLMLQVTNDVKSAARDVKADGSPESMIKLQESIMRRDMAVEQVVGLRAEWGRTGNVFQEFMRDVKDQQGLSDFLKGKGRSSSDLNDIAHTIDALDGPQAARMLNDLRTPTAWDKFKYYWVNSLISGPVTHAKYIVANGAFAGYESAVVTPLAGAVGTARRALTGGAEGVYMGEAAARTWGIVAGVPDAIKAAVTAAKTGMQTALPGELAQSIIPKNNKNIAYQQRPIGGTLGAVIGAPSRGASAIHSFFNFLGYRASIEAQAYRQAAKEGLSLSDDAFWQRRGAVADRPTPEMMNDAIEEGYRLTYISELGETGRKLSAFVNATKVGQLVMPFTHIPLNILKRAVEGTPAAFLDAETREALSGAKGATKQDTAIARMVSGSAIGAWAMNQVLNERMTGYGPTDQKERAQWMATGHQPYSIRIGDYWYSFNRFGSLGTMLGLYSNLAEVIPHLKPDSEELTKAIGMIVHSTGRLMEDEVGMQGLAGLMDAINEPDRKGVRFVSNFAGSLLPYSSMQRQVASSMDPYMRETKSVVDGLRYYIPVARQGLLPKRDWSGMPVDNASYGGDTAVPGISSIIQHRNAVADPVAQEMTALDIKPAPPQDRIKGVKLPPKLYDTYQSTAGPFTRTALESMINQPGWHDIPISVRQDVFKHTIEATRSAAAAAMQMSHPELIQQGVSDRLARINGVKPTKLQDAR